MARNRKSKALPLALPSFLKTELELSEIGLPALFDPSLRPSWKTTLSEIVQM